jgi:hypothetical protein
LCSDEAFDVLAVIVTVSAVKRFLKHVSKVRNRPRGGIDGEEVFAFAGASNAGKSRQEVLRLHVAAADVRVGLVNVSERVQPRVCTSGAMRNTIVPYLPEGGFCAGAFIHVVCQLERSHTCNTGWAVWMAVTRFRRGCGW